MQAITFCTPSKIGRGGKAPHNYLLAPKNSSLFLRHILILMKGLKRPENRFSIHTSLSGPLASSLMNFVVK